MAQRTVVNVKPAADPWPVIDAWAARTGRRVSQHGEWGRTYEHGDGFFTARSAVEIVVEGDTLLIESWIIIWFTNGQLDLASGQPLQYFPRRKARKALNDLLVALGAPPVR